MNDYIQRQRRRREQAYLAGFGGDVDEMIAAETAAAEMSPVARAVMIGVATGAITLIVNRLIDRIFFDKK